MLTLGLYYNKDLRWRQLYWDMLYLICVFKFNEEMLCININFKKV